MVKISVLISILALCLFAQASYAQDEAPLSVEVDQEVERATDTQQDVPLFKTINDEYKIKESTEAKEVVSEKNLEEEPARPLIGDFEGTVTQILDGDTIEIDGEPMRLLGVNAPEKTHSGDTYDCYSDQSARFLAALVLDNVVTYSFDTTYGRRDRYGDTRVYVFINGTFVNAELIAKGQAFADTSKHYSAREEFVQLQVVARRKHLGLWHTCPVECDRQGVCRTKNW